MNNRTKTELTKLVADLEVFLAKETAAAERHTKAGQGDFSSHAAWCAGQLQEAIELAKADDVAGIVAVVKGIIKSTPASFSKPQKKPVGKSQKKLLPECSRGNCNHPEHM